MLPAYAGLVLASKAVRFQIEGCASGASSSMQNISQENLADIWITSPPLEEQDLIVEHIRRKSRIIKSACRRVAEQLHLLQQYRNSLVSRSVTGQIDPTWTLGA